MTKALMSRLPNSTQAWNCRGAATLEAVHVGQSGQPSPEPVRRTAAPEMIVSATAHTAAVAITRNRDGETTRQARTRVPPVRRSAAFIADMLGPAVRRS